MASSSDDQLEEKEGKGWKRTLPRNFDIEETYCYFSVLLARKSSIFQDKKQVKIQIHKYVDICGDFGTCIPEKTP